jgi:hypothetical protein
LNKDNFLTPAPASTAAIFAATICLALRSRLIHSVIPAVLIVVVVVAVRRMETRHSIDSANSTSAAHAINTANSTNTAHAINAANSTNTANAIHSANSTDACRLGHVDAPRRR